MAFKLANYEDDRGTVHPESYWTLVALNISKPDRALVMLYYGYHDKAAYDAKKQNISQKSYTANGDAFDAALVKFAPIYQGISDGAAATAMGTKDVVVDPNDPSKNVSFFENATVV